MNKTLIPAYGRDYKSAREAKACFAKGNDWIIADISDPYDGKPTSVQDFKPGTGVNLRYKRLTMITVTTVPDLGQGECKAVTDMFNGKGVADE